MAGEGTEVLVVDDNPDIRVLLSLRLGFDGRFGTIHEAETGDAAVVCAGAHHDIAAVILDQEMPGATGIDVLPELRGLLPDATIVMYTSDESIHGEAMRLGADAALTKPATLEQLLDLLVVPHSG